MAPAVIRKISDSTVRRLSLYLRALEDLGQEGSETVSSETLSARVGTTAAQVRKDLSALGSFGKRGLGYPVASLLDRVRDALGLDRTWRVALVGAGRIGSALHAYPNFGDRGFRIVSVLDRRPGRVGDVWGGVTIRGVEELEDVIRTERIEILILAVPPEAAQDIATRAAGAGVRGILNFAPVRLRVPEDVAVNEVNLTLELEAISHAIRRRIPDPREGTP